MKTETIKRAEKCASNLNASMKRVFSFYEKREKIMIEWKKYYEKKEKELLSDDN